MPIHDSDWSLQYFAGVPCPEDVDIPAADGDAWRWNPRHRGVYNKLELALGQGIRAAPHGVVPDAFPVFSKPIMNLHGMGAGSRVLVDEADYDRNYEPGHMWMELLEGDHVSSDAAVVEGTPHWFRHATGLAAGEGMFDYWTVHAQGFQTLQSYLADWIAANLSGYTGMVNFETIDGRIIEAHLRLTDQWPDLYGGRVWVEAVIGLYAHRRWDFDDNPRLDGYSLALFGPAKAGYRHPPQALAEEVASSPGISSLQVTFHEGREPSWHSNPPGGFRLAVVNCRDLAAGRAARLRLARWFGLEKALNIVSE